MICPLGEWGVKVYYYYYCVTVNFSFYVCQCLSYVLRCFYDGYIGICNYYVFLMDCSLDRYVVSFLQFSSVQSLSCVRLFATPSTAVHKTSLSITNSWSLPDPMSIESVMPSNPLILCRPLLLLPSIFPSIRVFSNESALSIRWPKYWSFSFNISPSNEHLGSPLGCTGWISLQSKRFLRVFPNTTVQNHQFLSAQLSL